MDFDDTPEEAAFRAEARDWIQANAPTHLEAELKRAGFASSGIESEDPMAASKAWQKKKAEAGWACLNWPKEYGGGARTPIERVIWGQEEGIYGSLSSPFIIGHGMCGPTVMAWAACCRPSPRARRSGASSSPSPPAAPTSPACAPAR